MHRKSRKVRKLAKILVRASIGEKTLAQKMSKQHGENISAFFRRLLKEENERGPVDNFSKATDRLNNISREMTNYLDMFRKKGIN
jgi:hypothetical protein